VILTAIIEAASEQTPIGLVWGDAEFDSEGNHTYVHRELGAQSVIPTKTAKENPANPSVKCASKCAGLFCHDLIVTVLG